MTYATHRTAWPLARHIVPPAKVAQADPVRMAGKPPRATSLQEKIAAIMADGRERTAGDVSRGVGEDIRRVAHRMGKMAADDQLLAEKIHGVRVYRCLSSERPREKRMAKGARHAAIILDLLAKHGPLTRPEMNEILGLKGRTALRYAVEILQRRPNARICIVGQRGVGNPAYVYDLTERAQA